MAISLISLWPLLALSAQSVSAQVGEDSSKTVMLVLITNGGEQTHILPQFLGSIDRLTYPKDQLTIWIRADADKDIEMFDEWTSKTKSQYKNMDYSSIPKISGGESLRAVHQKILVYQQQALETARNSGYNFVLFVDCDVLIRDEDIISHLVDSSVVHRALVVSPVLEVEGKWYSNYWSEITEQGGFGEKEEYFEIHQRSISGCFDVELVHSLFLLNLDDPQSKDVSFNSPEYEEIPKLHAMVGFSKSARSKGRMVVCNDAVPLYGEISVPVDWLDGGQKEKEYELNSVIQRWALDSFPMPPSEYLTPKYSRLSEDFDMVYIINLKKRVGRKAFMQHTMYEMGVKNYKFFEAVDGKALNSSITSDLKVMTGYEEPFHHRSSLTPGEIGCFLSHYYIWKEAEQKGYKSVLILEDDAKPITNMLGLYDQVMDDLDTLNGQWDLLYLGRKYQEDLKIRSYSIPGLNHLVRPGYSYWLVAYALSDSGIKKVLAQDPLRKMIPTDEYLPILFNEHPNATWKENFNPRDLIAVSAEPRLIFPSHYIGDSGYLSDTEHVEHGAVKHDEL